MLDKLVASGGSVWCWRLSSSSGETATKSEFKENVTFEFSACEVGERRIWGWFPQLGGFTWFHLGETDSLIRLGPVKWPFQDTEPSVRSGTWIGMKAANRERSAGAIYPRSLWKVIAGSELYGRRPKRRLKPISGDAGGMTAAGTPANSASFRLPWVMWLVLPFRPFRPFQHPPTTALASNRASWKRSGLKMMST